MENTAGQGEDYQTLVPKTSKAQEYHKRYYLARASRVIDQIYSQPLTILICGPSEEASPLALKRTNTINELRRLGHDANSGEELVLELEALDAGSKRTANVYENVAAAKSELIVIFCASPGSIGEAYEFLNIPDVARKTLVFIDRKHRRGYARVGILEMHRRMNGLTEEYETEDIDRCRLMSRVIEWVKDHQAVIWMTRQNLLRGEEYGEE